MNSFEMQGHWWKPTVPGKVVAGTLSFSEDDGIFLSLIGSFDDLIQTFQGFLSPAQPEPILLGFTDGGKMITLTECRLQGSGVSLGSFGGMSRQRYRAEFAFVGAHFDLPEEVCFNRVRVGYTYLAEWVGNSGLTYQIISRNQEQIPDRFELHYERPSKIVATMAECQMTFSWSISIPGFDPLREGTFRPSAQLTIQPTECESIRELLERYIDPMRSLVSLATTRNNAIEEVVVYSDARKEQIREGVERAIAIQVFFQPSITIEEARRQKPPVELLFRLSDVEPRLAELIERWLGIAKELDSVYQLYFGAKSNARMYLEQEFLSMVQAAESYHRRRRSVAAPSAYHRARLIRTIGRVLPADRAWIIEKLRYSHEPGLRQRLKELFDESTAIVRPLVRNKSSFIEGVTNTRNYLTHYDPSLASRILPKERLYWGIRALTFLVEVILLKELGFTDEQCIECFKRIPSYQHLSNLPRASKP